MIPSTVTLLNLYTP